jgi:hypothetical protein
MRESIIAFGLGLLVGFVAVFRAGMRESIIAFGLGLVGFVAVAAFRAGMRESIIAFGLWLVGFVAVTAFLILALTFQSWPADASPRYRVHRNHNSPGNNASVFCDRVTATGSMNCGAMVFAHRTLPLGSVHRLSCPNGKVIAARVVDRGPAAWTGRNIDLSTGLARACGVNGLGRVGIS